MRRRADCRHSPEVLRWHHLVKIPHLQVLKYQTSLLLATVEWRTPATACRASRPNQPQTCGSSSSSRTYSTYWKLRGSSSNSSGRCWMRCCSMAGGSHCSRIVPSGAPCLASAVTSPPCDASTCACVSAITPAGSVTYGCRLSCRSLKTHQRRSRWRVGVKDEGACASPSQRRAALPRAKCIWRCGNAVESEQLSALSVPHHLCAGAQHLCCL